MAAKFHKTVDWRYLIMKQNRHQGSDIKKMEERKEEWNIDVQSKAYPNVDD